MSIEHQIKRFVAEHLLFQEDGFVYEDSTSFLGEGIIDSLGVMELVTFVQQSFRVVVEPTEVTPDNFDSVSKLADYIRRKQAATLVAPIET